MYCLVDLCLLLVCVQRIGDESSTFVENQTWEVPEQVFAEEGKYSLTYVLFTMKTYFIAQSSMLNLRMTSHFISWYYFHPGRAVMFNLMFSLNKSYSCCYSWLINDELKIKVWLIGNMGIWACFVGLLDCLTLRNRFAEWPPRKTVQPQDLHGLWAWLIN